MNISRFFIDRPIFAAVLSLLIFLAGLISVWQLPISEYPEVVPPSVEVHAVYPGANPKVIAETVAAPLEEQINGVEGMLYMASQGTSDGQMSLVVTFQIGTDPDKAQQLVQNRVSQALPRLPDIVRQFGVTTVKSSPDLTLVVHIVSPKGTYDPLYLGNYATLNIKDRISRIKGIGQVMVFGGSDYAMRIWLDPEKIAARNMAVSQVVQAIREQNVQVAAGIIGAAPAKEGTELQLNINAQGRLQTEEEFGEIIIKTGANGGVTRLKDVARIELGASQYALRSLLDNKPAVALGIFQAPGSNALDISEQVNEVMETLKRDFPEDVDYSIVYDPTTFVRDSIKAVIHTLLEAIALVVLVVIVFLQTWRASLIPLLAVPVSIVGTFAFMLLFGFSINALTLFGLVLAIGIVVDDAIVVVENVERNISNGLSPKDATYQAMREVSGPIIAIGLTLIAVFVPISFISGLTGQFYRQFALTIAISTVISAFNSLTLSPAMAALLLKAHGGEKDGLTRFLETVFGGFFAAFRWFLIALIIVIAGVLIKKLIVITMGFGAVYGIVVMGTKILAWAAVAIGALFSLRAIFMKPREGEPQGFDRFNRFFKNAANNYSRRLSGVLNRRGVLIGIYLVLIVVTALIFSHVPRGYIPAQDKQYLIGFAQLPDGASLDRTDEVIRRMSDIGMKTPGVDHSVAFPGLSIHGFSASSSSGIVFLPLKPFEERKTPDLSAGAISGSINQQFGAIKDAFVMVLPPPPIMGLGTSGGFKLQIQDRADLGEEALFGVTQAVIGQSYQTPGLSKIYSGYQINVPQLKVEVDRTRAKQLGVSINSIFETMQVYLGSLYINDFNKFGRTYQVIAQADAAFRAQAEDIGKLKVPNMSGQMVPLASMITVMPSYGPERSARYNSYRSADINAEASLGFSTGEAQKLMTDILEKTLPRGMTFEWTDLTYQQILAGDSSVLVFPFCVLLVFLVLAAQYESLVLPLAVILIVPMSLLCAILGVWFDGSDNNIFTQIGFIVLVGLACKNAILIVEFARELELEGRKPYEAAVEAARLRLRPILMTSFAFIMGVVPLVLSSGAGAEMRHAMGVAVFAGMLGVTFFGLFLTPVFYVALRTLFGGELHSATTPALHHEEDEHRE